MKRNFCSRRVFTGGKCFAKKAPSLCSRRKQAQAIMELRHQFDLVTMLNCIKMARSTFYYYSGKSGQPDKYEQVRNLISRIYHDQKGRFSYRRIVLMIKRYGVGINHHKVVLILMGEMKLKSLIRVKKYRSYRGDLGKMALNILNREFKADKPSQKWATDVTEFKVREGKLYLNPIIDLFNQVIIRYELTDIPVFKVVMDMLKKSLPCAKVSSELVLDSDQRWQYQMHKYRQLLRENGITQSMSRKGNCLHNAVIENFFRTLKSELFYMKEYESTEQLKNDIKDYIFYYNKKRIKLNLNVE
ncbi:IS3 family transposase [Sphingobacterium sp. 2149]|uniref:IS3 family transposase n=1 Tax=Sphingobacterium sp. 2149 TaxID=2817763 RepID=UPI001AE25EA9|nr:IS3 family transposase [Sphingobacterium sp. 2149]